MPARRAVLALPFFAASAGAATWSAVPPFPAWVGRTALLRGDGGSARLLLNADGTGLMAVRLLFLCRPLPVLAWRMGEDGLSITYRRVSVLDSGRVIPGEARILPDDRQVLWIEAQRHLAEFEGFAEPAAARRCS